MINVFIVDDNDFMRKMMGSFLEMEKDIKICGEADSIESALGILDNLSPDIALVDISLNSDEGGIDLIKNIRAKGKQFPILTISLHENELYAKRISQAGGQGYIMKQEAADCIIDAVRQVARGETYFQWK